MKFQDLSVVLPIQNPAEETTALLRSLPAEVHLIAIDCGQTGAGEIISKVRPDNSLFVPLKGSLGEAYQMGAEMASTPWLLFCRPHLRLCATYFNVLSRHNYCDLIYGPILASSTMQKPGWDDHIDNRLLKVQRAAALPAANLCVRRSALLDSHDLSRCGGVEIEAEISRRMLEEGYTIHYDPNLIAFSSRQENSETEINPSVPRLPSWSTLLYLNQVPFHFSSIDQSRMFQISSS